MRMQASKVVLHSWDDLVALLDGRPNGISEISYLLSFSVEPSGKRVSISSLVTQEASPYLLAWQLANAEWAPPLYEGTLRDWPNPIIEAFQVIGAAVSKAQLDISREQKRKMREIELRGGVNG